MKWLMMPLNAMIIAEVDGKEIVAEKTEFHYAKNMLTDQLFFPEKDKWYEA